MAQSDLSSTSLDKIHRAITGNASFFYDTLQLALWSYDTGQPGQEITGHGYARQSITGGAAGWNVTGTTFSNAAQIAFPAATSAYGNIHELRLYHPATGDLVYKKVLASPFTILSGQQATFPIGNLTIGKNASSNWSDALHVEVMNAICGFASMAAVAGLKFALYTSLPAADGTGGTEVSGNGYAPHSYAGTWTYSYVADSAKNVSIIEFPEPTAPWGTIAGVVVKKQTNDAILVIVDSADITSGASLDRLYIDVGKMEFKRSA